jgi:hypothetical protein
VGRRYWTPSGHGRDVGPVTKHDEKHDEESHERE